MPKIEVIVNISPPGASWDDKGRDHLRIVGVGTGMSAPSFIRRTFHQSDTHEHTVAGLLTKRADLLGEALALRDRMAEINNDIAALDRVLVSFGFEGDLDEQMPRQKRRVLFGSGELTRGIVDALRDAPSPMSSREIASTILELSGSDARDRKLMADHTRRVSKALRQLREAGRVMQGRDDVGRVLWRITKPAVIRP